MSTIRNRNAGCGWRFAMTLVVLSVVLLSVATAFQPNALFFQQHRQRHSNLCSSGSPGLETSRSTTTTLYRSSHHDRDDDYDDDRTTRTTRVVSEAFMTTTTTGLSASPSSSSLLAHQGGGGDGGVVFSRMIMTVVFVLTVATTAVTTTPLAATASSTCVSGVGEGCANLAQGNSYIQALQEKSAANKQRNEREARDAYYMKNYPDWFQSVGQTLIKKESDGTFFTVNDEELAKLRQQNLLTLQSPKSMGGRVMDYTQKPILTLKDTTMTTTSVSTTTTMSSPPAETP